MQRREMIKLTALAPLAPLLRIDTQPDRRWPASLDLGDPAANAVSCMMHRMDPAMAYRPWFGIEVKDGRPVALHHATWDLGDTSGRFVEAFILARQMNGAMPDARVAEQRIREFFYRLIGPSGVIEDPRTHQPDHMFSQGSALYALVADLQDSPRATQKAHIEAFIAGLDHLAVHRSDYLMFPQVATKIAPCSHQAAYQVFPVVRFYELTGYKPALRYASNLSRWAFYYDPTVTSDGVITKTFWEGHLHAWMDTYSGIIRCARAGGDLDQAAVLERSRKLYEWVRLHHTSPFGWVADSVGSQTCETDTITSFIRLALELIRDGHTEYWDDIERFVRNQLVENQFRDVSRLEIKDPHVALGLSGAFESYADPNTLLAVSNGTVEGCCISGGVRGLFIVQSNAVTASEHEVRVNLLLNASRPEIDVISYLPYQGRIELYPKTAKPVALRLPAWLRIQQLHVSGGEPTLSSDGRYVRFADVRADRPVIVTFEQPEEWREHIVAGKKYRALWRGDTVLEIEPHGGRYPIFERAAMRRRQAPVTASASSYGAPLRYAPRQFTPTVAW